MIIWICTDMEGLAGVDHWDQCYDPDDSSPAYLHGREQLTADTNAAVAGCFDAGATEVRVLDGHGRNRFRGFLDGKLDPRARQMGVAARSPLRWKGLDASVHALAIIGQHAMAGTLDGFLDHTEVPKEVCRFCINGREHGELGMMAAYAGAFGVPIVYASGDEALCREAQRLFPHVVTTPTKRGTGWATCELHPVNEVRAAIRRDLARALEGADRAKAWRPDVPVEVTLEWAWSGGADAMMRGAGVERVDARTVRWSLADARDIYDWPPTAPSRRPPDGE